MRPVSVTFRVARVVTRLACMVDVHVDYDDGPSKKFSGEKAVLMPRSKLPHVYLFATHHCSIPEVMNDPMTADDLHVVRTVLDPPTTLPRMTLASISPILEKQALWLWSKKDDAVKVDTLKKCCRDLASLHGTLLSKNEDFAKITNTTLRMAAFELLGRPSSAGGVSMPLLKVQEIAAAFGPNASMLSDAILHGGLIPDDLTPKTALGVSTCTAAAEYFTFYTCLPAVSYHHLLSISPRMKYIVIDRCAAYTERDMHTLMTHIKGGQTTQIIALNPPADTKKIIENYFRTCICVDVPASSFLRTDPPPHTMSDIKVNKVLMQDDTTTCMKGDYASLASGEIVEIARVAEMISGFPDLRERVSPRDPVSRFSPLRESTRGPPVMFQPPGERIGFWVAAPLTISTTHSDAYIARMAALSLSGYLYI
jgi:hypothetical protein